MGKVKNFIKGFWSVIVFLAYVKFYLMCMVAYASALALSVFMLDQYGQDISHLVFAVRIAIWYATAWTVIIIIDKFIKLRQEGKRMNEGCEQLNE